jgi:hypothetical protein
MSHAYDTVIAIARLGVNIELRAEARHAASTLIEVASTAAVTGAHAIIDVSGHAASTALEIARVGGKHVTIRF